jgi:tetratricopeptide (TPR) repeat protein
MGRFREAVAGFSEVIRLSPNCAAAYVNSGVAFQGMNDHRRAISDFERGRRHRCQSRFASPLAYGSRGISWKFLEDFDRAVGIDLAGFYCCVTAKPMLFPIANKESIVF